MAASNEPAYRGRIAPSPTGYLHLGHARTFWIAQERARAFGGTLILRNEDLDPARCKPEFIEAFYEDLRWFGFEWQEGPDMGGPFGPYNQSERMPLYLQFFEELKSKRLIYPCVCSRKEVQRALSAPHAGDEEPVYPGTCRNKPWPSGTTRTHWRFRVPDGRVVRFEDGYFGPQEFVCGRDFGDFVVWRIDGFPSYQLAVVVDDALMKITEVVRGTDLLLSTARQILLYEALGWTPPRFHHCPLMTDENGVRLAKRTDALSLRQLRANGADPVRLQEQFTENLNHQGSKDTKN